MGQDGKEANKIGRVVRHRNSTPIGADEFPAILRERSRLTQERGHDVCTDITLAEPVAQSIRQPPCSTTHVYECVVGFKAVESQHLAFDDAESLELAAYDLPRSGARSERESEEPPIASITLHRRSIR
jgi:hypothetical protein